MASISRETIGNLHDKITVVLQTQDYLPVYEKDVKSLGKTANIPGFRQGKVPVGVIKKMYGSSLYADAVTKSAEKELQEFITKENISLLGQPVIFGDESNFPKLDYHNPKDYEFLFEIGIRPDVKVEFPAGTSVNLYKVKVKPEDIDNRIESYQAQFGKLNDTEKMDGPDTITYITLTEVGEDGTPVEGGLKKNTSVYAKVFTEDFQKQLQDKKKDDILKGTLEQMVDPEKYPGFYQNLEVDPKEKDFLSKHVELKIDTLNTLEKAELNEDLFKKAFPGKEIKTEEDFRKAIEEDEQQYWDMTAKNYMNHNLMHIMQEIPVSLPEDFLKRTIKDSSKEKLTDQQIDDEFSSFAGQLKWTMITDRIIKDQHLSVSRDDLRQDAIKDLKSYFSEGNLMGGNEGWLNDYADKLLEDQKQTDQRMDKLLSAKIFDWAMTQIDVQEPEISQEDFQKELEHHEHHH